MAISKQSVVENLSGDDTAVITTETKIDKYLQERYDGQTPVYFAIKGVPHRVVERLKQKYRQAGWTVAVVYDQRDGDALGFS